MTSATISGSTLTVVVGGQSYGYQLNGQQPNTQVSTTSDGEGGTKVVLVNASKRLIADSAVTTGTDGKSYINQANFNGGSTTLTGTADPGDTVAVGVNGGAGQAAAVGADGNWSFVLSGLSDGQSYSAVATATGPTGDTATNDSFSFTVDTSTSESAIADSAVTTGTDGQSYIDSRQFNGGVDHADGQRRKQATRLRLRQWRNGRRRQRPRRPERRRWLRTEPGH